MASRGILDRISFGRGDDTVTDRIRAHLHVLLNTRVNNSATVSGYGISDFSEICHNIPDAIPNLRRSIRNTILRYEPRVTSLTIREVEADELFSVGLEINGRINNSSEKLVHIVVICNSSGRFTLL